MEPGVWIAVIFGGILILGGLFGTLKSGIRGIAIFAGAGLILFGAFGPDNVKNIEVGKEGVKITRYQPTQQERELALNLAQDKPSPEIEKEGERFIEQAEERTPEQRSPEDYLALATEKWRAKDYDAALADVFAGMALNPKNIRTKASLIHRKGSIYYFLEPNSDGMKFYTVADRTPRL